MTQETWLKKAERYLASARLLLEKEDIDSSVSRTYYALRFVCSYFLEQEGFKVDRGWKHDTLLNTTVVRSRDKHWLRDLSIGPKKNLAVSLNEVYDLRNDADYGRNEVSERQAGRALAFVQTVLQAIKENVP
ncbi:MAG: HEPN domain-containing protein [Chloroflexota bacterium]|nr:HEPN domain-containing protein [Chloroflexota bacterium]